MAPEAVEYSHIQPAAALHTPGTTTIETLVAFANAHYPREDRQWTAADTLKNVVVALTHPDGEREVLVIGVPGDRDVDLKRAEASLAPALVEPATEADFTKHPELVPGYIGPAVLGQNAGEGAVRYLLDPRVVEGTSWITGDNRVDYHVYNLVAGRDFVGDGWVEAAEVRAGDDAPDGSGPLEMARGIEIGHVFQLGRKYAEALGLSVLDENGKARIVTMGSYGLGVSRAVAALVESHHDEHGITWPIQVAPAHVHVIATGKDQAVFEAASALAKELDAAGIEVLYDDRVKVSAGVKFADSELIGVPFSVVIGRSFADGVIEIRERATGERAEVPAAEAAQIVIEKVREALS